jgi:hypothetical protein
MSGDNREFTDPFMFASDSSGEVFGVIEKTRNSALRVPIPKDVVEISNDSYKLVPRTNV